MAKLDEAKANRARVKAKVGEAFYIQQEHCLAQWKLGELPPENLVLGELPQATVRYQADQWDARWDRW